MEPEDEIETLRYNGFLLFVFSLTFAGAAAFFISRQNRRTRS